MRATRIFLIAAMALPSIGCGTFQRTPAVRISDGDTNLNTRWHGTLASPAQLAGVVQLNGTATMAPGAAAGATVVNVEIGNASPGGEHPWSLHRGTCNRDEGVVGDRSGFKAVRIGNDGRGSASSTVNMHSPTSGRYSVWVRASEANASVVVGCANLAPPSM